VKAYLRTFGCRANQYDTEAVRAMILASGGEIVDTLELADVAVLNSCAVTADAEADLRRAVRGVAADRQGLPVIVMGCASARDDGRIAALPGVQHVIAGADLPSIAMALDLDPILAGTRSAVQTGSRALLRIQDGCDEHCTFCATTLARGANRSRPAELLVQEATELSAEHPEIVITGIHIGSYGIDHGSSLSALMSRLVREVPAVRFRLSSLEATEVDVTLAELLADDSSRIAPHLHAPLQSGADRVLKRMGRHWYSAASYASAVLRLADHLPIFALGADVITGFPGETAADHAQTVALVQSLPFTYLHVFPYSARPGTAAERLGTAVDGRVSRERGAELRSIGEAKGAAYRASRAGTVADVVVIGAADTNGRRHGLTEDYLSVTLDDPLIPRRARIDATLVLRERDLVAVRR
jgi:threonylcarbamoyladenosine tRNA methylthiotransferase MtaB